MDSRRSLFERGGAGGCSCAGVDAHSSGRRARREGLPRDKLLPGGATLPCAPARKKAACALTWVAMVSIRVGADDLFAVTRAEGPPRRNVYRIFDKLDRAVTKADVDSARMVTGRRDRGADAAPLPVVGE